MIKHGNISAMLRNCTVNIGELIITDEIMEGKILSFCTDQSRSFRNVNGLCVPMLKKKEAGESPFTIRAYVCA